MIGTDHIYSKNRDFEVLYSHQQDPEDNMGSLERQRFLDYSYCKTCSEEWEETCCNCIKVRQPNFFGADSGLDEMSCYSYLCYKFIVCFCCWWFYSCWVCVYFVLCCGTALCITCVNCLCKRNKEGQSVLDQQNILKKHDSELHLVLLLGLKLRNSMLALCSCQSHC